MMNEATQLAGQYKYVITRANGDVEESPWFDNLILDSGLNMLGTPNTIVFNYLQIGSGTNPVVASQTKLTQFIQSTYVSFQSTVHTLDALHRTEHTYQAVFEQGAVVGIITELGVGNDSTGLKDIFSRVLITDANNVPTSITVVALDQLTVFYKLTITPPLNTASGSFVIAGVTYNYVARVASVDSFSNGSLLATSSDSFSICNRIVAYGDDSALGPITEALTGTESVASDSWVHVSYTPSTHTRVTNVSFGTTQANLLGGIQGFLLYFNSYGCMFQVVLDKPIPKTNTKTLTLNVSFSWGRG